MQWSGPRPPDLLEIDDVGAGGLGHFQAAGPVIDGDDALGAQEEATLDAELAHRAQAPDGDRVALLDVAVLGRLVGRREDVGEEQDLFVVEAVGDLDRTDIAERDADILRLAPGVTAHHVRIAEQARSGVAVERLHHRRLV